MWYALLSLAIVTIVTAISYYVNFRKPKTNPEFFNKSTRPIRRDDLIGYNWISPSKAIWPKKPASAEGLSPTEKFDLKRINFRDEVLQHFQFLVSDLGYEEPLYSALQYSDTFRYCNKKIDRYVEVSNAYHPNDYGFEIAVGAISTSQAESPKLLLYKLKEEQNISQDYIMDLARKLRVDFNLVLLGLD
jgi:hypothetical protein